MRTCSTCGRQLESDGSLCPDCWGAKGNDDHKNDEVREGVKVGDRRIAKIIAIASEPPEIPSFGRAVAICLRKFDDCQGRASRSEFWYWILFCVFTLLACGLGYSIATQGVAQETFSTSTVEELFSRRNLALCVAIPILIFLFNVTFNVAFRRLQDINLSGAWVIAYLVVYGALIGFGSQLVWYERFFVGRNAPRDVAMTGAAVLIAYVAFVALVTLLPVVVLSRPSARGRNRYGGAPLRRGATCETSEELASAETIQKEMETETTPERPGFRRAIAICFRKYANFKGRASRSEFWYWILFWMALRLVETAIIIVVSRYLKQPETYFLQRLSLSFNSYLTSIISADLLSSIIRSLTRPISAILILPTLAVAVRRLHDLNASGAWAATYCGLKLALFSIGAWLTRLSIESFNRLSEQPSLDQRLSFLSDALTFLYFITALGVVIIMARAGTKGDNYYGPAPQKRAATLLREPERNLE